MDLFAYWRGQQISSPKERERVCSALEVYQKGLTVTLDFGMMCGVGNKPLR